MLTKTLTFGLGRVMGFSSKPFQLPDDLRKAVYTELLIGFRDFATLCNYATSLFYISRTIGIDLKSIGFNTSYAPILDHFKLESHLNGLVLNQSYSVTKLHFTGDNGKHLKNGKASIPNHRTDGTHPLFFGKEAIKLYQEGSDFYVAYHVFATRWAKENNFPDWITFPIIIKANDKVGKSQLEKTIEGEWRQCSGQLARNLRGANRKYIMHLSVKYEPQPHKPLSTNVGMGIHLGFSSPVAICINNEEKREPWAMLVGDGQLLLRSRAIVRREIIRILRALKKKDSPITGKDRDPFLTQLRKLRKREKRIIKTASQKLAATVAEIALKNGAGTWQIGKYDQDVKYCNPWLARNWTPGILLDAIRWQAAKCQAKIVQIDPKYTSQRCSACGYIDRNNNQNLKTRAKLFKCQMCGYEDHIDKNAARNICITGIEQIILDGLK